MPGYEVNRFVGNVDPDLVCTICLDVMRDPLQLVGCEHTFCGSCIRDWVESNKSCPIDRRRFSADQDLQPAPRILKGILSRLQIKCDFEQKGCEAIVSLESLKQHIEECAFNLVLCDKGCGLTIVKHKVSQHSCVSQEVTLQAMNKTLKTLCQARSKIIADGEEKIAKLESTLKEKNSLITELVTDGMEKISKLERTLKDRDSRIAELERALSDAKQSEKHAIGRWLQSTVVERHGRR